MNIPANQSPSASRPTGGGLFRTADGRNFFITFALVTSLFLLWGFCSGMIDILNKHFQDSLHINKEQSGLVQSANYLAYFLMAIPAGLIARKFGYKGGILAGLTLIAGGAFWFVHAVGVGSYSAFLLGLFVIAAGMTCLETIANPYTTVLGATEHGATRINIAQTINGAGWMLGPMVGGYFVFGGDTAGGTVSHPANANANAGLATPYLGIGIFVALLLILFIFSKVPDLPAEDESKKSAGEKIRLQPSDGQLTAIGCALAAVCGLLYFFIAPILGLIWALLNMSPALLNPTRYGLLVAAYIGGFLLISKNWDLFRRKHFTFGIGAQFFYVAAQTGIFSFCVNYILENDPGATKLQASKWLGAIGFGLFMFGRLCGSAVVTQFKPHLVLAAYAIINVALTAACMLGGTLGLYAMFGTFFFMSIMFPTIFALGIRGLGDHTKLGASLIVMSIVGGAIAAPFMGRIADMHSMRTGFVVPLVGFALIALYGLAWPKLEAKDSIG
jgi:FHS family L-fucose permease-like MFS transporter